MVLDPAQHCGTQAEYGSVSFRNVMLRSFDQTTVYDESNTDKLYDVYEIDISSQVHKQLGSFVEGQTTDDLHPLTGTDTNHITTANAATETAVTIEKRLQGYLMQPRLDFRLLIGEQVLFSALQTNNASDVFANPGLYDVDSGPKPVSCVVTDIIGTDFFNVDFKIRCAIIACDPNNVPEITSLNLKEDPNSDNPFPWALDARKEFGVINNRWQVIETRDRDMMLTRIVAGKLRTRHPTFQPNVYRHLCLPPQPRNMQAISQEFVESTNGQEMNYRMIYRQRLAAPPWPAIDWDATHREGINSQGAAHTIDSSVDVTLKGSPGTPKESLLNAALQVCIQRQTFDTYAAGLNGTGPQNKVDGLVYYYALTIVDQLDENVISVNMSTKRPYASPSSTTLKFGGLDFTKVGVLPPIAAYAPVFNTAKNYLPGDIISDGGTGRFRALKKINAGSAFNSSEWQDVTAQIGVERDDRNGVYLDQWPEMQPYDPNTSLGQFSNYWQNPCITTHGMPNAATSGAATGSVEYQLLTGNDQTPELEENTQVETQPANVVYATSDNYETVVPSDTINFISSAHQSAIYTHIEIQNKYRTKTGQYGIPRSEPFSDPTTDENVANIADRLALTGLVRGHVVQQDDNNRFYIFVGTDPSFATHWRDWYASRAMVQVHAPISKRTVYFSVKRISSVPALPSLSSFLVDPNVILETLDAYDISPAPPIFGANGGQQELAVEGWLSYFQERAIDPTSAEVFQAPSLPWDTSTLSSNQLQYAVNASSDIV